MFNWLCSPHSDLFVYGLHPTLEASFPLTPPLPLTSSLRTSIPALPPLQFLSHPITKAQPVTWLTEEQEDGAQYEPYTTQTETVAAQPLQACTQTHVCAHAFRKQVCQSRRNRASPFFLLGSRVKTFTHAHRRRDKDRLHLWLDLLVVFWSLRKSLSVCFKTLR